MLLMTIHVARDNQQLGVFPLEVVNQGLASGRFLASDLAWHEGLAGWVELRLIAGVVLPAGSSAPPQLPPARPAAFTYAQPAAAPAPRTEHVPNYLPHSIIATLLCCLPFGIVGIVYATQVDNKLARGDLDGARRASRNARNWTIASALSMVGLVLIYLVVIVITAVAESR